MKWKLRGWEVERTGRGHDFRARKRHTFTGKVIDNRYIEAKSGDYAKLSPLQKKMKTKYGGKYVEDKVDPNPFKTIGFGFNDMSKSKKKQRKIF